MVNTESKHNTKRIRTFYEENSSLNECYNKAVINLRDSIINEVNYIIPIESDIKSVQPYTIEKLNVLLFLQIKSVMKEERIIQYHDDDIIQSYVRYHSLITYQSIIDLLNMRKRKVLGRMKSEGLSTLELERKRNDYKYFRKHNRELIKQIETERAAL